MPRHSARLDVRTRRTLLPGWNEEELSSVPCPVTGTSRSLATCKECERYAGIVRDSEGHWFLLCHAEAAEPLPELFARLDPSWGSTIVADAMNANPYCVREDVELREVVALLVEHGISGAPVVDDRGWPIGMVSKTDLLVEDYELAEEQEEEGERFQLTQPPGRSQRLARDIMTRGVVSISERAPLGDAVHLMTEQAIHRLPVVDAEGLLVGVLSTMDILRALKARAQKR
jgi:CBS-domain-containing membrane protein